MQKRRLWWVAVWFAALFLWNLWRVWTADDSAAYLAVKALSMLTTPINILLSIVVIMLMVRWSKKPRTQ